MADNLAGFVPDFVEKEEPREIILRLGKMITNRIPVKLGLQKLTKYDPEYWGLSLLLTDEQAAKAPRLYPAWKESKSYTVGERIRYNGILYKVLQAHTSQEDWTPDVAVSLFAKVLISDPIAKRNVGTEFRWFHYVYIYWNIFCFKW